MELLNYILKVLESYFQYIFNGKSVPYAKTTVSPQKCFSKIQFEILYRPFIFIVSIMSQIHINVYCEH